MKIVTVDFAVGAANLHQLPKNGLPEIVFIGRSNVGKSSLLNKIAHRKNAARISSTPGKTRELNYYLINKQFYFVDLPGYGYAKVAEHVKAGWTALIENYFLTRKQIAFAVQIVDARLGPTDLDNLMIGWLDFYEIPFVLVMTKADKTPVSRLQMQMSAVKTAMSKYRFVHGIIPFSAVTGEGRGDLLTIIEDHLVPAQSPSSKKFARRDVYLSSRRFSPKEPGRTTAVA
ncbi:MAG: YihA family ribosome biogenesis GTP-binding protein [Bacteroidota bacterium]|nr:YihA family ribosome biogenesis GTP-binding protein [Bacteroidota bacterium]